MNEKEITQETTTVLQKKEKESTEEIVKETGPATVENSTPVIQKERLNKRGDRRGMNAIGTNLRPFKKGQIVPGRGRPKGSVSIKDTLRKSLNKENAKKIVDTLIKGAENGQDRKTETLLRLTGDLTDTPAVTLNQTNNTINADILSEALSFLANKQNMPDNNVIEVKEVKNIADSISPPSTPIKE